MSKVDGIFGQSGKINPVLDKGERDDVTAMQLALDGVSILLGRGATDIPEQTVIIAHDRARSSETAGDAGMTGEQMLFVIGASDLNIKVGDIFKHEGTRYSIIMVDTSVPGRIRAQAKAQR